ncbi:hypothetical protein [Methyloversatilis sp.]|uniref:hypothetical protein n=1 Tax=Methyloversatilis sp. TaxID=2569862 RepID=UPI0035AFB0A7
MFNLLKHPTFLVGALNVLIVAMITYIVWRTGNPLALLGITLLQQVPIFEAPAQDPEHPHDSGDHRIGFNADIE